MVGVIGTVVGGSDTGSVIGAKLVPATGAEFFGFFSRSRSSPSTATSSFLGDGSRFGKHAGWFVVTGGLPQTVWDANIQSGL